MPAAVGNADYQGFTAHVLQCLGRNKEASERYQAASRLSPKLMAAGGWAWFLIAKVVLLKQEKLTFVPSKVTTSVPN